MEVYRACQIKLDREVAVKVLSHEFLASFEGDEEEIQVALERFHREVMAMARCATRTYFRFTTMTGRFSKEMAKRFKFFKGALPGRFKGKSVPIRRAGSSPIKI